MTRSSPGSGELPISDIIERADWYSRVDANAGLAFHLARYWPQIRAALQPSSAGIRDALIEAIDSPTVAALENVFNGPNDMTKSTSERIVEIIAARMPSVAQGSSNQAIIDFLNAAYDAIGDLGVDNEGHVKWAALVNIQREIGQKARDLSDASPLPSTPSQTEAETLSRPGLEGGSIKHPSQDRNAAVSGSGSPNE